jgi:hypothetical protein
MAVDIHKLIAAISPQTYCQEWDEVNGERVNIRNKVKKIVSQGGPDSYLKAAEVALPLVEKMLKESSTYVDPNEMIFHTPIKAKWLGNPVEKHVLSFDAVGENLEPLYFWVLDYLNDPGSFRKSKGADKLVDNFVSSASSSHFSEMGMKATKMQDEAMKMLGAANQVIKSIINILYDLKEFKIRLEIYDDYQSKDEAKKKSAIQSLKQIWLDTVDMKRGNTAIKQMAIQYQYVTLIDAFFAAESVEQVMDYKNPEEAKKAGALDLNDRVKRILQQRLAEFYRWINESERELRKRYEIEKLYLKSQVNSVQLYSRWIKPYLKAAKDLEQRATTTASLVNTFNTTLFELTLLAKGEYAYKEDINRGDLPKMFINAKKRDYWAIMVVEMKFRSIPGRIGQSQNYVFRGKLEATFTSYSLNDDELKVLKEQVEKDDLKDLTTLIENSTSQSLDLLMDEINQYLDDNKQKKKGEEEEKEVTPWDGLFSLFSFLLPDKEDKNKKADLSKGIPLDNGVERVLRSQAILQARQECAKMYTEFKKAQGMSV